MKKLIKKIIPPFILSGYHLSLSFLGALIYGFPSKKINVVGVTGTSGKSSVISLTTSILEEAGLKVASMSSIEFKINGQRFQNELKMTMPGRMKIQKFINQAVKANCQYLILEVTSEGIEQYRHKFIDFKIAVFTNLSKEHIEAHGSFENYREAKLKLFKHTPGTHIINTDDSNAKYFTAITAQEKIGFGISDKSLLPTMNLIGDFNLYNAIAATKIAMALGVSLENCQKTIGSIEVLPGRMEVVANNPTIIIDYAHTPTQLELVYQAIKGNKICVLGSCGGGRDKWKRPVMGQIASRYCKEVIVTNEDPYDEDPQEIIDSVVGNTRAIKIIDRKEAIKRALELAKPEDTVIITGKGSEMLMCTKEGKIPWSDKQIVLDLVKK